MEDLSRLSEEQLKKLLGQKMISSGLQQNLSMSSMQMGANRDKNQPIGKYREIKLQDPKLFKRASYHVGLAYYIHVEKLKKKGI